MARKSRVGRPPKSARLRKTRRIQMLLTPDEHKKLAKYAEKKDTTVSGLLRARIRALLEQAED